MPETNYDIPILKSAAPGMPAKNRKNLWRLTRTWIQALVNLALPWLACGMLAVISLLVLYMTGPDDNNNASSFFGWIGTHFHAFFNFVLNKNDFLNLSVALSSAYITTGWFRVKTMTFWDKLVFIGNILLYLAACYYLAKDIPMYKGITYRNEFMFFSVVAVDLLGFIFLSIKDAKNAG